MPIRKRPYQRAYGRAARGMSLDDDFYQRTNVLNEIIRFLYRAPLDDLEERLFKIVDTNLKLTGTGERVFIYRDKVFNDSFSEPDSAVDLDPRLHLTMDRWIAESEALNESEIPEVMTYLKRALNTSDLRADYVRLLPVNVHEVINSMMTDGNGAFPLTDEQVSAFVADNQEGFALVRERSVINLLQVR